MFADPHNKILARLQNQGRRRGLKNQGRHRGLPLRPDGPHILNHFNSLYPSEFSAYFFYHLSRHGIL
ncbi:uncharacterized protein Dvar_22010 [Desulfosarcina variabilis str. Montpellier]